MCVLYFHLFFSLQLVVLAMGTAILIWTKIQGKDVDLSFARFIGYFIVIFAVISMICTGYYAVQYKSLGYFDSPHLMMMKNGMMSGQNTMQQGMMSGQMMSGKTQMMGPGMIGNRMMSKPRT